MSLKLKHVVTFLKITICFLLSKTVIIIIIIIIIIMITMIIKIRMMIKVYIAQIP